MIEETHSPSTINYKVNEASNTYGQFVLVFNKTTKVFTLHAHIGSTYLSTNDRKSIILALGFNSSSGCDFLHGSECYWTQFFKIGVQAYNRAGNYDEDDFIDQRAQYAHALFNKFTEDFGKICDHYSELKNLVPTDYVRLPMLTYSFEIDPELLKPKMAAPVWVEDVAPKSQIDLRDELLGKIEVLKNDYVTFSELLFQSGEELELAVKRFLEFLGMKAEQTEKAFPIDLIAEKGDIHLAIEVTGTNGNINNKNGKVGQVITYAGEKQENEKIILVANTFRNQPITERPQESFTPPALKILKPFDACLVTGVTLYEFWKDVLEGRKTKDETINLLNETVGILEHLTT
jgi:hypothetical protein